MCEGIVRAEQRFETYLDCLLSYKIHMHYRGIEYKEERGPDAEPERQFRESEVETDV